MNIEKYLRSKGFDPDERPFLPILPSWEQFPIVKAIRAWERKYNQTYTHKQSGLSNED